MTPGDGNAPERRCARQARRKDLERTHHSTSTLARYVNRRDPANETDIAVNAAGRRAHWLGHLCAPQMR
jgi:hypothetical protein